MPAEWEAATGHAELPGGRAEFAATANQLEIVIRGDDTAGLDRARAIVEDHLLRYTFREDLARLVWEGIAL